MKHTPQPAWDLLFQGARVVDPANHTDARLDIGIAQGVVADIGPDLDPTRAKAVEDLHGFTLVPGLIDVHVHLDETAFGYHMVAQTGVVSTIDFAGSVETLRTALREHGAAGLSVGFIKPAIPGRTISAASIPEEEQERFLDSIAEEGALGVKLLGGHYPIDPKTFADLVRRCDERGLFIASHVGTTRKGSNLEGLREAIDLADGHPLYIAHVNSYCRGSSGRNPVEEAAQALSWIENAPNVTSENYIARINGCTAECKDGLPISRVTRDCLERRDYPPDEEGLAAAIRDGYACIQVPEGRVMTLADPENGLSVWRRNETRARACFPVNSIAACCALALARNRNDALIIDILSTDGGRIPRNTLVSAGLSLVRAGGWSVAEFVQKTSLRPAQVFGLTGKGHLSQGADADITVLDLDRGRAALSVSAGRIIMRDGQTLGGEGRFLTRGATTQGTAT